ncbi:unnamed protein product [Echinostoma caproni]|uniref:DNA-directed RNA polymerase III subunit RPC9 n=1 Tax=Echinostoma caproni TaxID=27848 RepID=A0A183A2P6_9TREM|nr:unnamed protein product [Echinostoma caproni]
MEVDRNVKLLTNFEVLQLINSKLSSKKKIRSQQTLLYTSSKYLNSKTPCTVQSPEAIHAFSRAVKPFELSKVELLMLINHCPSTQVELSVVMGDLLVCISPAPNTVEHQVSRLMMAAIRKNPKESE